MRAIPIFLLIACFSPNPVLAENHSSTADSQPWGVKAASYLDGRLVWWMGWPAAARDHQTFCISCHTVLPYALARPALRAVLGERAPSPIEQLLLQNVTRRVRLWSQVKPFYSDETRGVPKTAESRGTESILNTLILVGYGAPAGKLSADTRLAFDHMWAQQLNLGKARGAWPWLEFHNSPWEGDSQYYGATLAAIAVGTAPGKYASSANIQPRLDLLREYLARESGVQILLNRVMLLWASTKLPGLLTDAQEKLVIDEALSKQQADGGFSLSSLVGDWKRRDGTALETRRTATPPGSSRLCCRKPA
jgi:squalene-hopene/tetraprenyl-beta-curcumene cyclase